MNFPTHMDQLIHDHQGALRADATARRVARSTRSSRRARRTAAALDQIGHSERAVLRTTGPVLAVGDGQPPGCEGVAGALVRLGEAVEAMAAVALDARDDRVLADLLVAATDALAVPAATVGLEPLGQGTSPVVSQRWLARLAERTVDQHVGLEPDEVDSVGRIAAQLGRLSAPTPVATEVARFSARSRSRRGRPLQVQPVAFDGC